MNLEQHNVFKSLPVYAHTLCQIAPPLPTYLHCQSTGCAVSFAILPECQSVGNSVLPAPRTGQLAYTFATPFSTLQLQHDTQSLDHYAQPVLPSSTIGSLTAHYSPLFHTFPITAHLSQTY
ncbi:hypothetical protein vseg_015138 [Gypsophila vaccaria]